MKIVLSRKGFDSSIGGVPSPILEDGTLISFPIPDDRSSIRYRDIRSPRLELWRLIEQLTKGKVKRTDGVHLDPDIRQDAYVPRPKEWLGVFGQTGAAQAHLARKISVGDVFLFFGWFRSVKASGRQHRYVYAGPDFHVLFGWLQIGAIVLVASEDRPKWTDYHPHCHEGFITRISGQNNTVYIATERLTIEGKELSLAGYGTFSRIKPSLCLTSPGQSKRSLWRLPEWFYPFHSRRTPLSYHADPSRWALNGDGCSLCTVGRGQEFVLDAKEYPEALVWLLAIINEGSR